MQPATGVRQWLVTPSQSAQWDLSTDVAVSGKKKTDEETKLSTAHTLWVPAVNNHSGFGRWTFLESTDPWDAKSIIRHGLTIER